MKQRILLSIIFIFTFSYLSAVPARPTIFSHKQSDGKVINLMLVGDEHMSYYTDTDSGERLLLGDDGDYHAMPAADYTLRFEHASKRRIAAEQHRKVRMTKTALLAAKQPDRQMRKVIGTLNDVLGTRRGLVILVNFADLSFKEKHTQQAFDDMFNLEGYSEDNHIGSVSDYFTEQSYGKLKLTFDVMGPVTLSQNYSYYGTNDRYGNDLRPGEMVREACDMIDYLVDFSDYDWDGDGEAEQVFIIYAGYGENNTGVSKNTIWPHEWTLEEALGEKLTYDGVTLDTYACSPELTGSFGSDLNGIGTPIHEFAHCLGYPDLYDAYYSGCIAMDKFDIMSSGSYSGPNGRGEVPCGFTAYERWMAGWLQPEELSSPRDIADMPPLNDEGVAYIIYNKDHRDEYMLLENRQCSRWFSYFGTERAGHGLFVTHIDFDADAWAENTVNCNSQHPRLTWVAADNSYGKSYGLSWYVSATEARGDFFPGNQKVTSMNGASQSKCGGAWYNRENGTKTFSHELSEITESDEGLISLKFDGGTHSKPSVKFDAGTGECDDSTQLQPGESDEYVLPSADIDIEGWHFIGWSSEPVSDTPTQPEVTPAGESFTPECDTLFYAVYRYEEEGFVDGNYLYSSNPMPNDHAQLVGIRITTPPSLTAYDEGDAFVREGMTVVADYEDGEECQVLNYLCSPDVFGPNDDHVAVSYTEKGITRTAQQTVTVTELPRYVVTFVINGEEGIAMREEAYQSGVLVPEVETPQDMAFAGWSTSKADAESAEMPDFVDIIDGRFIPTEDVTLFSVYCRQVVDSLSEPAVFGLASAIECMPDTYHPEGCDVEVDEVNFTLTDVARSDDGCIQFKPGSGHIAALLPEKIAVVEVEYHSESPATLVNTSEGNRLLIENHSESETKVTNLTITCERPMITVYGNVLPPPMPDKIIFIETVAPATSDMHYDLAGRRVNTQTRGIVIIRGRKILQR